jgi:Protein of unknown function (DUF1360)
MGMTRDAPAPLQAITDTLEDVSSEYSPDEERPLASYSAAMATYAALVGGGAAIAARAGVRAPETIRPWDLALVTVATHKLSRLISRANITSPLRAPFTRYRGVGGPAELAEDARGDGHRHVIGELLTCPFCLGQWIATGFVAGLVVAPRQTRVVAAVFAALAGSDALQLAYCRLQLEPK